MVKLEELIEGMTLGLCDPYANNNCFPEKVKEYPVYKYQGIWWVACHHTQMRKEQGKDWQNEGHQLHNEFFEDFYVVNPGTGPW